MKQIEIVDEFQVYFSEFQRQLMFSSTKHEMIFYDRNCATETYMVGDDCPGTPRHSDNTCSD